MPLLTACGTTVTSRTTLAIDDPSRVAVLRGDQSVLPQSEDAATVALGPKDVEPAPAGHSQVSVTALRSSSGAISFKWDTRLPIANGEQQTLFPARSTMPIDRADLTGPAFRKDLCVALHHSSTGGGYRAVLAMHACGEGDLGGETLAIETPWSNVVITRRIDVVPRTRETLSWAGAGLILVPLVVLGYGGMGAVPLVPALAATGGTAAVGGLLLGASTLFPRPYSCEEILSPGSAGRRPQVCSRHPRRSGGSRSGHRAPS